MGDTKYHVYLIVFSPILSSLPRIIIFWCIWHYLGENYLTVCECETNKPNYGQAKPNQMQCKSSTNYFPYIFVCHCQSHHARHRHRTRQKWSLIWLVLTFLWNNIFLFLLNKTVRAIASLKLDCIRMSWLYCACVDCILHSNHPFYRVYSFWVHKKCHNDYWNWRIENKWIYTSPKAETSTGLLLLWFIRVL